MASPFPLLKKVNVHHDEEHSVNAVLNGIVPMRRPKFSASFYKIALPSMPVPVKIPFAIIKGINTKR